MKDTTHTRTPWFSFNIGTRKPGFGHTLLFTVCKFLAATRQRSKIAMTSLLTEKSEVEVVLLWKDTIRDSKIARIRHDRPGEDGQRIYARVC